MTGLSAISPRSAFMRFELWPALLLHVAACCWSLVYAAESFPGIINFDKAHLLLALLSAAPFAIVSILFVISRFSFGYFLGFYFYTVILGYLWLIEFSQLPYDRPLAWVSIFLSGLAFLAPALNAAGLDVAVPSYSLCPAVSVMDIVGEIRLCLAAIWKKTGKHPLVVGHSAGGHLTAAMLASDWSKVAGVPADLVRAGVAISGVFDVAPLIPTSLNEALRLDAEAARTAQGPHAGGGGRRGRKRGVPAAKPGHRGGLEARRIAMRIPRGAGRQSLHGGGHSDEPQQRALCQGRGSRTDVTRSLT